MPTLLAGSAALILSSCNDLPSQNGAELVTDTLTLYALDGEADSLFDGYVSQYLQSFVQVDTSTTLLPLFQQGALFVGRTDKERAVSYLRLVQAPDSLGNLSVDEIQAAELVLTPWRYAIGDTNATSYGFTIREVTRYWSASATTDSLKAFESSGIYGRTLGQFTGKIALKDTMETLYIPMDKVVVNEWLQTAKDSLGLNRLFGIGLVPDNNSSAIHAFTTRTIFDQSLPQGSVRLIYRRSGATASDTVFMRFGYDGTWVEGDSRIPADGLVTQGGLAMRSKLYFDVSRIPRLANIHKAELRLHVDSSDTRWGNLGAPPLSARFAVDSSLGTSLFVVDNASQQTSTGDYIFGRLDLAIQRWVRGDANYGVLITQSPASEIRQLDRVRFYGPAAAPYRRPKLTVVYSYYEIRPRQ